MDPNIGIWCATERLAALRNHYDALCKELANWHCEAPAYPIDIDAAFEKAMIAEAELIASIAGEANPKAE